MMSCWILMMSMANPTWMLSLVRPLMILIQLLPPMITTMDSTLRKTMDIARVNC